MRKNLRISLLVVIVGIVPAIGSSAADEPQREMWEEPSHQLVFEQGNVRILDIRIVPGVTSEYHSHHFATVYVRIQDALMLNQDYGQEWNGRVERPYGAAGSLMNAAGYFARNTYHRVRNTDDRTFHLLSIVNGANPLVDIEPVPAGEGGSLLNNAWFAEHRVDLDAGETSGSLSFDNDVVLVQFNDDGESYVVEDGVTHSAKTAVGAWSWHAAGATFQIINGSDDPLEMLVVEVKNQISVND
jgi:hypothetical protein